MNREALIARLLRNILVSTSGPPEMEDIEAILINYKLYCTPQFLVNNLKEILKENSDSDATKLAVSQLLSKWATVEHSKFIVNTLLEMLPPLISRDEMNKVKLSLITKSENPNKAFKLQKSIRTSSMSYLHYNSDIFHGYGPDQVARALTVIDWSLFVGITRESILRKGWQGEDRHILAPALDQLAQRFDKMSFWVASQILLMRPLDKQAKLLTFLIKVMKNLVDLKNHQSAQQILSGLNMASVQRLKRLWALIPFRRREIFDEIDELFSPIGNHAKYREIVGRLETESTPCIPYIAMYLRDIVYVFDGNPEFTPEGEINFERTKLLAQQVKKLLRFQQLPFDFDVPEPLVNYLRDLKGPILSEEELWELSVGHQPLAESVTDTSDISIAGEETEGSGEESEETIEPVSLQEVVTEPLLCNGFRKFLARDNCAEYLYFYRDLNRYMILPDDSRARKTRAREIVQLYLSPSAQLPVSLLTPEDREAVCATVQNSNFSNDIFDSFQQKATEFLQLKLVGYLSDSLYKSSKNALQCIKLEDIPKEVENDSELTERDWAILLEDATELTLHNETALIQQDTPNSRLYRLKSGALRIEKVGSDGIRKVVGKIDKPVLIGEMSIFNVSKATASVIVHGCAEVYCLEVDAFRKKLLPIPQLGLRFYRQTGKQLAEILTRVSAMKREKSRVRAVKRTETVVKEESENTNVDNDSIISRFQLDSSEEVVAHYHCKCVTGVVNKQVDLYITSNNICVESRIFGQKSRECIPIQKIKASLPLSEKNTLVISTKNKKRRFVMKQDEVHKCHGLLENLAANQQTSKLASFIRTSSSPEFSSMELTSEEWDVILSDSNYASLRFTKDDVIMQQGLKYNMVCQISAGSVRVEKQHVDCVVKLAVLGVGEIFGEITFVSGGLASATVIANEDVELFVIHQRSLDKLFASGQETTVLKFYHYLCSVLARRIVEQEKSMGGTPRVGNRKKEQT